MRNRRNCSVWHSRYYSVCGRKLFRPNRQVRPSASVTPELRKHRSLTGEKKSLETLVFQLSEELFGAEADFAGVQLGDAGGFAVPRIFPSGPLDRIDHPTVGDAPFVILLAL